MIDFPPHGCVRRRFVRLAGVFLLACLAAAACAAPTQQPAGDDAQALRVMSFNIRYGTARDGDNAWPLRRDLAFRTIREFDAAVLGMQEVLHFQLEEIGAAFPAYARIGTGRDDGREAGEYAAILYDTTRLSLLGHDQFWLSDTPAVPGSMTWGNRVTRVVTWARFRDRITTRTFYVFNTHWDHESQPSRERSAQLLLDRIAARGDTDPVLVTGDFNAGEANAAFRALLTSSRVPLRDTFRTVHPDARDVGTFNAFTGVRTGDKIDAVLVSPAWRIHEAAIIHTNDNGRYPSDHFPVTAVVSLTAR